MRNRFIVSAIALIVFSLSFSSCKKYEEGPGLSFVSKKERVANDWAFKSAIEDGSDVTEYYTGAKLTLDKSGNAALKILEIQNGDKVLVQYDGSWLFESKKQRITMNLTRSGSTTSQRWSFVIKKLKEKEMHLEGVELDRDWILVSFNLR